MLLILPVSSTCTEKSDARNSPASLASHPTWPHLLGRMKLFTDIILIHISQTVVTVKIVLHSEQASSDCRIISNFYNRLFFWSLSFMANSLVISGVSHCHKGTNAHKCDGDWLPSRIDRGLISSLIRMSPNRRE